MFNDFVFSWAENTSGQMVHIDSVLNGLQCGCHCPHCKEPLLARHGDVKAHGFAHHSNNRKATLKICYQVILYKVAEHIIKAEKHIHAPSYYGIFREKDIWFKDVKIDSQYERIDKQPDVVAIAADGARYLVEFTFSYKVQHKQPIDYQNMNCLEVNLEGQTLESLRHFLLNSDENRKWVNNQQYFSNIDNLYQKAGKPIRITQESTCAKCPIINHCAGAVLNGDILKIENNGNVFRLCKAQEYDKLLKEYYAQKKKEANRERIKKMSLEERLNFLPEQQLIHVAYFTDGTVKFTDEWSSKELHKKWYDNSVLEFTVDAGEKASCIAAMYVRHQGYDIKDCLICRHCFGERCLRHVPNPDARYCELFSVSPHIRQLVAQGYDKWIVKT